MFKRLKFIIICIPLVFAGISWAETDKKEEGNLATLPEVVVTATRTKSEIERVPASITVITQEEIKNSNAGSIPDLLRSGEGIVVRNLIGNGKTAQVDLRGYGETGQYNTLVLVDGRKVNAIDQSGVDWAQIPIDQVERIEIVRGTGTVLYGDNAVGGVINIITKTPAKEFKATGGTTFGSYGRNRIEASVGGGWHERIAATLNASLDETDGYRKNNRYESKDAGGKIVFDASDYLSLTVSGSHHEDEYGLPGPLTEAQMEADRKDSTKLLDEGSSTDSYIRAGFDLMLGNHGNFAADISYRDSSGESIFPVYQWATESDSKTWGVNPRYIWNGEIFDRKNKLVAGVDLYWSELDKKSYSGSSLNSIYSIGRDSAGIYFNDEYNILEDLIISLGARHEKVRYDYEMEDITGFYAPLDKSMSDSKNAYNVGLTFMYAKKSSVFIRANRSFRFPLTDELVYEDWFAAMIRANPNLKPQTGIHYETGIRHSFTERISGSMTLFRAEIENEIFFNPLPFVNENHPETLHQGVEIGCKAKPFDKLTLFGNFTYEEATFEKAPYKGNEIPAVPRFKGYLGFRVDDVAITGLAFSGGYNYVGSSHLISDQANNFDKIDSYYTIDAKLAYKYKMLKAFVGVNNLTDRRYSEYGIVGGFPAKRNFYPAPERNFFAGIQFDI